MAEPRDLEIYEMLLFMIRSLADRPDDIEIAMVSDEDGPAFLIQAHPTDVGRLIGRNGQTARALQTIVGASATKPGQRFSIDIAPGAGRL